MSGNSSQTPSVHDSFVHHQTLYNMSGIGPSLPPHLLAKRKRQREESASSEVVTSPGAKRAKSPAPEKAEETETQQEEKRPRVVGPAAPPVIGPTPPPAPLDERPTLPLSPNQDNADDDSSSSDDDDFGPAPPSAADLLGNNSRDVDSKQTSSRYSTDDSTTKAKRDDWMMVPPTADDLSSHLDPTKLRARGFNTGKSARAPKGPAGLAAEWTENPEEKLKRLQNEAMGVKGSGAADFDAKEYARNKEREEQARNIKAHTKTNRGPSLIEQHQKVQKIEDDDPSKRAFDREKDIGGGMVNKVDRQEMLKKAGDFSSKFAGGNYL